MNHTLRQHHTLAQHAPRFDDLKHLRHPPERQGPGILAVLLGVLLIAGAILATGWLLHAATRDGATAAADFEVPVACPERTFADDIITYEVRQGDRVLLRHCVTITRSTWAPRPKVSASRPVVRVEQHTTH